MRTAGIADEDRIAREEVHSISCRLNGARSEI